MNLETNGKESGKNLESLKTTNNLVKGLTKNNDFIEISYLP